MMDIWFDFENAQLVIEPASDFEFSFLNDFLGDGSLSGTVLLSELDKTVVGIAIKSEKELVNRTVEEDSPITEEDVDIMYDEMLSEDTIDE
jgi:hypothetical protein